MFFQLFDKHLKINRLKAPPVAFSDGTKSQRVKVMNRAFHSQLSHTAVREPIRASAGVAMETGVAALHRLLLQHL